MTLIRKLKMLSQQQGTPPVVEQIITLNTTSTSSTWTPQEIINSGDTLIWEVKGGVTIAPQVINTPIFNLSSNTGTANITIKSVSNFSGFSVMQLDQLSIISADITEAIDLTKIDFWDNKIGSLDLTQNILLETIWLQDTNLSSFDLLLNTVAKFISLDFNNNLDTVTLDKIVNDLDTNGISNGNLKLSGNAGLPLTSASTTSYDNLITKGWTIDVAAATPVDITDPVIGTLSYANVTENTVELSCTATDDIAVTEFKIYKNTILLETVLGSSLSGYEITGLIQNTNYDFYVVAYDAAGNFSLDSNTVNFITSVTPSVANSPLIHTFTVESGQPSRVYFNSSKIITASTGFNGYNGFTISGRAITEITIQAGLTTGHYFTIDLAFIWWDNNTIKYEEGSDIADLNFNPVYPFTMENIVNNNIEPVTSTDMYVNTVAQGLGDGSSEENASTLTFAFDNAVLGETWWIKKGLYSFTGDSNLNVGNNGTVSAPIKFKGYDTTIGDLDADYIVDYFNYVSPANALSQIDSTKFPVIQGNNTNTSSSGIFTNQRDYLIFKNIQIRDFYYNFWSYGSDYTHFENCTAGNAQVSGGGQGFRSGVLASTGIRVVKSLAFDNAVDNIWLNGSYGALLDSKTYSGIDASNNTDYNIVLLPANNFIIKGNLSQHYLLPSGSDPHGIGIKQLNTDFGTDVSSDNLIVDNILRQNSGETIYVAHQGGTRNVIKRNKIYKESTGNSLQGCRVRNGAHNNIFEYNYYEGVTDAFNFYANIENRPAASGYLANDNIFRNNIFNGVYRVVNMADASGDNLDLHGNLIYNNTFYNLTGYMWVNSTAGIIFTSNEFKNNIIYGDGNVPLYSGSITATAFDQQYNNYYNTGVTTPAGIGNISENPNFISMIEGGFKPQNVLLKAGILIAGIEYDYYKTEKDPIDISIGAVEVQV